MPSGGQRRRLRKPSACSVSPGSLAPGGTVTLVIAGGVRILVDTGGPADGQLIVDALKLRELIGWRKVGPRALVGGRARRARRWLRSPRPRPTGRPGRDTLSGCGR